MSWPSTSWSRLDSSLGVRGFLAFFSFGASVEADASAFGFRPRLFGVAEVVEVDAVVVGASTIFGFRPRLEGEGEGALGSAAAAAIPGS